MKIGITEIFVILIFTLLCFVVYFARKYFIEFRNNHNAAIEVMRESLRHVDASALLISGHTSGIFSELAAFRTEFNISFDDTLRKKLTAIMTSGERPDNMMRKLGPNGETEWVPIDHGF